MNDLQLPMLEITKLNNKLSKQTSQSLKKLVSQRRKQLTVLKYILKYYHLPYPFHNHWIQPTNMWPRCIDSAWALLSRKTGDLQAGSKPSTGTARGDPNDSKVSTKTHKKTSLFDLLYFDIEKIFFQRWDFLLFIRFCKLCRIFIFFEKNLFFL